jgi:hypothetical protein
MTKISKIKNAIKRKVNESRVRKVVSSILDDSLPNLLAEIDQLDQAFLDAKPVKEEEDLEELDVRKTHGDKRIENPATGNDIKLRTALKAKKGSAVYAKGKAMYNALKDTPANESKLKERAYASTDGKPTFDYDPGEGKLTEAEDYKYKKYVAKAFKDILGAQFDFRHAMGVKQLTNKDMKLKKKADAIYKAIIDLQKEMKSKGLTEASRKDLGMSSSVNKRRAAAELKQKLAGKRSDGMGKYTATIYGMNGSKRVELKSLNDLNKFSKFELDEGKLTEAKIKKGDVIKMQDGEIGVVNKVKGRVAYIKLPSSPGSFHPIEADRTTYKGKHKGKDIYSEIKGAPRNESAKDKFGAPPMNKWWTGSKESLMSAIYHAQRQVPPSNKAAYEKNWKNIVKQLQRKFPAPTAIYRKRLDEAHPLNKVIGGYPVKYEGDPKNYRAIITEPMNDRQKEDMIKRAKKAGYIAKPNMGGGVTIFVKEGKLTEVQAMNMDTVPYNTVMKMKPGSTIKMKDGKIRTKDKFGNWRANTDRNDIIVNRDIVKHMKGMKGYNMGGGRVQIEGKAGRKI